MEVKMGMKAAMGIDVLDAWGQSFNQYKEEIQYFKLLKPF